MSPDAQSNGDRWARSTPETFRGRALSAALTVDDLQVSLAWYRDVVGFHVDQVYEEDGKAWGASLRAGNVELFLTQDDGAKGWDREKGVGMSFQISTVQDLDELAALIRDRGGTLDTEPQDMPWGERLFRITDPDGFTYSISTVV